ncbi:MAG: formate--tetrahydrofolate ligase [Deltaproteobacteria bacterium]|jgi:formate--tetrahydrofolate ligase|nr:formate--tetrahydrofolate ligase [Deltaproteobacteria bacterium]
MKPEYDPTKQEDWQISEIAEEALDFNAQCDKIGILPEERIPYGRKIGKVDYMAIRERLKHKPDGCYIDVTAIVPTPLGEGKTTTTMGLIEGLGKRGINVGGAIRQPSGGPSMNIKGSAAGGGIAQLIPLADFTLGLTGDINAVTIANNLAMVAVTSRLQHEFNYDDEQLGKIGLKRLNIDPKNVAMSWCFDLCAQALRHITIGRGAKMDGFEMDSSFCIAVASEVMAILSMFSDMADLRKRLGEITVACDKKGNPVTTEDLECAGAMTAWMAKTINPNLLATVEMQPVLVHAGPFGNIAVAQSSIVADQIGLKLFDYHVTESGFGADLGFEKFWNVKCRASGLIPNVAVLTATVRALKHHGVDAGALPVRPGRPIPQEYFTCTPQTLKWLEAGMANMIHCINIVKKSGIKPVVCINVFPSDTPEEIEMVRRAAETVGARAPVSKHWQFGGDGALELADAVMDACKEKVDFKFLYPNEMSLRKRIETIAREVYGADGVTYTPEAEAKAKRFEADSKYNDYHTMMVKTHLSLTDDPARKGVPKGWSLAVRDFLLYSGAKYICPCTGTISLMPGTSSNPAFRRVDVNVKTGKPTGLF